MLLVLGSLEEFVCFGRVKVRDMDGDFVVLDFLGRIGCSIDDRSHHEPTNNGPSI